MSEALLHNKLCDSGVFSELHAEQDNKNISEVIDNKHFCINQLNYHATY